MESLYMDIGNSQLTKMRPWKLAKRVSRDGRRRCKCFGCQWDVEHTKENGIINEKHI